MVIKMGKIKSAAAVILAAMLSMSVLASCGTDAKPSDGQSEQTSAVTEETTAQPVPSLHETGTIRDITASELVKEMNVGWNLGNTLDAVGGKTVGSEMSWGCPKTTKAMIDEIKNAGFNVLRLPITWESHIGAAPDYTIDEKWMARVKEVVDYGSDNDMYVIINLHHEEWYSPTADNCDKASDELNKVWAQIAECFKDYDEHLIFEGMNEPRNKGSAQEWNGGTADEREIINKYNKVFVETVRSSGGNNDKRVLMLPTYGANSNKEVMESLWLPENDNKIIVSIHAYTPYGFALNTKGTDKFSSDNQGLTSQIDYPIDTAYEVFVSKGTPVIIGEMGAMNKDNLADRVDWTNYYISRAKEKGIVCIWWDNNNFNGDGERFGLFDRKTLSWPYPEIVKELTGKDVG